MKPQRPKSGIAYDLRELHTRRGRRAAKRLTGKQARAWSQRVIKTVLLTDSMSD